MDNPDTGMDREVKIYFSKIMKSFTVGLLWLLVMVTAGLFFRLGYLNKGWHWYNGLFYGIMGISLLLLLRYYTRLWQKRD